MLFPMVALEERSLQLAVGRAASLGTIGMGSASSPSSGEPIAVYDLTSGRKKRVLHFRLTPAPSPRQPYRQMRKACDFVLFLGSFLLVTPLCCHNKS